MEPAKCRPAHADVDRALSLVAEGLRALTAASDPHDAVSRHPLSDEQAQRLLVAVHAAVFGGGGPAPLLPHVAELERRVRDLELRCQKCTRHGRKVDGRNEE